MATANPYEDPCCQETNFPEERILCFFFSAIEIPASWSSGNVF